MIVTLYAGPAGTQERRVVLEHVCWYEIGDADDTAFRLTIGFVSGEQFVAHAGANDQETCEGMGQLATHFGDLELQRGLAQWMGARAEAHREVEIELDVARAADAAAQAAVLRGTPSP